jgi:hypothetical protein
MIKEPIFLEPRTYRDLERYRLEEARVRGWNEAMECIFGQELEQERVSKIRKTFYIAEQTERSE